MTLWPFGSPLLSPAGRLEGSVPLARKRTGAAAMQMAPLTRPRVATDAQAWRWLGLCLRIGLVVVAAIGIVTTAMVAPGRAQAPQQCGADGFLTDQGKVIGGGGVQPDLVIDRPC